MAGIPLFENLGAPLAAGPPRKAMGPPRQGAGVGIGMLRGVFLGDLKASKI